MFPLDLEVPSLRELQLQTCMGVLTLLVSVPVAAGKKAEHRNAVVFVKEKIESCRRSINMETVAICYQVVSRSL